MGVVSQDSGKEKGRTEVILCGPFAICCTVKKKLGLR